MTTAVDYATLGLSSDLLRRQADDVQAEQAAEQLDVATPGSAAGPLPSVRGALDDLQTRADAGRRHLGDR